MYKYPTTKQREISLRETKQDKTEAKQRKQNYGIEDSKTCLTAAQDRKGATLQAPRCIKVHSGCELIASMN
jgi:hypothetical protein